MIELGNHIINEDVLTIMLELKRQLALNGINRFAKFKESGNNIQTNCPFHKNGQERKPSFGINKKTGECNCFGCGWKGHITELISNCFGKNDFGVFGEKWLIKNFMSIAVENRPELDLNLTRNKSIDRKKYIDDSELEKYRYYHPYMWKRKFTPEIVELFDIGYDSETACITFPVRDITGGTLFIARRSVNTKFFNYPENAEKPLYGIYEIFSLLDINPHEIIICESMIDAITCFVYGKIAVALNGLGNELQFKQLNSLSCRKFILATDMDESGIRARQRIKSNLKNKIVTEYIWDKNIAKDINDMSKEYFDSLKEVF